MMQFVLLLIFMIQYPLLAIVRISDERAVGEKVQEADLIHSIFDERSVLGAFAIIGVVILAGMLIGMERNTRRHDFNLSLPYPRKDLFLAKAMIGLGAIIVMVTLAILMACLIVWFSEYRTALADFNVIKLFLIPLAAYMGIFAFSLLMGCIAGEMISQIILSLIFLMFPVGFTALVMGFFMDNRITLGFSAHSLNFMNQVLDFITSIVPPVLIIDMDEFTQVPGLRLILLSEDIEVHFMELPKLEEEHYYLSDRLTKWLLFLKGIQQEEWEELAMETPELKKAMTTLEFLSQDKEVRRLYEMRQKALLDERSALGKARREGKEEVAVKLLADGMDIPKVAELTGLSETEIKELNAQ